MIRTLPSAKVTLLVVKLLKSVAESLIVFPPYEKVV